MAEKRRLATYVRVAGRRWGPEHEVPADIAAKITNPKAWASDENEGVSAAVGEKKPDRGSSTGARLARFVYVGGRRYGPGDVIPDEVARRIMNLKAWEGGVLPFPAEERPVRRPTKPPKEVTQVAADEPAAPQVPETVRVPKEGVDPPPRHGRGSSLDAWQAFAVHNDVEFPDGANREAIIAACVQAGIVSAE